MSEKLTGGDLEVTRGQNRNYALADGFLRMVQRNNSWHLFLRYQAQTERHYRRAVEEFERLKALRPELPNEPISEPQPEQTETASTLLEQTQLPPENAQHIRLPAQQECHALVSPEGERCQPMAQAMGDGLPKQLSPGEGVRT